MSEEKLIRVHTCQGWELAQIFKSKLEAAGIPVLLKYESAGLVYGITVNGLGAVRIMVPESYAAEAETLLEGDAGLLEEGVDDEDSAEPLVEQDVPRQRTEPRTQGQQTRPGPCSRPADCRCCCPASQRSIRDRWVLTLHPHFRAVTARPDQTLGHRTTTPRTA